MTETRRSSSKGLARLVNQTLVRFRWRITPPAAATVVAAAGAGRAAGKVFGQILLILEEVTARVKPPLEPISKARDIADT